MKRLFSSSLSRDYLHFSIIAVFAAMVISCWLGWKTHTVQEKDRQFRYGMESDNIAKALDGTLNNVSYFAKFIGEKIAEHGADDLQQIAYLLKANKPELLSDNPIFSWTLFDWVKPDDKMYVSSNHGIFHTPLSMSSRTYLKKTHANPWHLYLSEPALGIPSGDFIIPAGYGVADKNHRYLGSLTMGFPIDRMTKIIESSLTSTDMGFVIVDKKTHKIVLQSSSNVIKRENNFFVKKLDFIETADDAGYLPEPIQYGNIKYSFFRENYSYPYIILVGENAAIADRNFEQIIFPRIVEIAAMGTFVLILLFFFRRRVVTPMITLAQVANEISKGNLSIKLPHVNNAEAFTLAKSLLLVKRSFARERRLKSQLAQAKEAAEDAHQRERIANESLELKVKDRTFELEKALVAKSEFLNNVSHEVRSPVQGVTVISEELVRNWQNIKEEKRFAYINQINESGKRLLSLVTNLLDLSKLDAGKMGFAMQADSNLKQITEDIIKESTPLTMGKELSLRLNADSLVTAEFDQQRIGQVIRNLLSNAIKFTAQGTILISITSRPITYPDGRTVDGLAFSIKDEGVGIPADELTQIFHAFTQSTRTKTRAGGTGLGLSICYEIITTHHGIIYAENNSDNGATFTFIIPLKQPILTPDMSDKMTSVSNVLIVDDETHCLMSMHIILEGDNYNVIEAQGGIEALEFLNQNTTRIDAILLDLMMPDMFGTDVLVAIKKDPRLCHIPIIIQSGAANDIEINKALQEGACSYISKPYNRQMLLEEVEKAISHLKISKAS
jgi:two-component system sensor histidine kinase ChiS